MNKLILVCVFFSFMIVSGQTIRVKAEKGDGIFSLLRKQGLNPGKYYADFIALNEGSIKNGSELKEGIEYQIPDAPDSYKKTALNVTENSQQDRPIFDDELASINAKSTKLSNAVIYLVPGLTGIEGLNELKSVRNKVLKEIAQELMVHGAQVYLINALDNNPILPVPVEKSNARSEEAIAGQEQLNHFVETININYLKNTGKYQRVVVLNFNETAYDSKFYKISLFHHGNSQEGSRFAQTLQDIFDQNAILPTKENPIATFENPNNLFLAKNALPPITMIDIVGKESSFKDAKRIAINPKAGLLTSIITNGVLSDYANLSIEE